jgi:hypothetical protein
LENEASMRPYSDTSETLKERSLAKKISDKNSNHSFGHPVPPNNISNRK